MKDDSREKRRRVRFPRHLPRLALLACLALVVLTLGMVLKPDNPPEPPEPPFSERARAAALADALQLRAAGEQLGEAPAVPAPADAARGAVARTVTLLTTQARALLRSGEAPATAAASPSAPASSAAGLASALAGSGRQRLADAAAADGGTARLLAAVGTAQLLQSSSLSAASGAPDPTAGLPDPGRAAVPSAPTAAVPSAGACPDQAASPSSSASSFTSPSSAAPSSPDRSGGDAATQASLTGALAALISTEQETVYGYQVALTRLDGAAAASAARQLARHESLIADAEALSRAHCAPVPPREAGYALDPAFLASPGPGLAALEAASLPAYGDLVALSDGGTRQWAISGLLEAARRAAAWGAAPGPVPGLAADPASFPTLPAG